MTQAFMALGGNIGPVLSTFHQALCALECDDLQIVACSPAYLTQPHCLPTAVDQSPPDFWNAVCELATSFPAVALMKFLRDIEDQFGRQRLEPWGSRTLDLDLLLR